MAISKSIKTGFSRADKKIDDVPNGYSFFNGLSPTNVVINNSTKDLTIPSSISVSLTAVGQTPDALVSPSVSATVTKQTSSAIISASWASDTSYTITGVGLDISGLIIRGGSLVLTPNPLKAGYIASGGGAGRSAVSSIDKLSLNDDSRFTLGTGLSSARWYGAGAANSGTAGYTFGGSNSSTISKIVFSNDAISDLVATISVATVSMAAASNSGSAGYICGYGANATIDKLTYSNDSKSTITATLPSSRSQLAAFSNSGTAGYFGGGGSTNAINKLTYSTEATATLSTTLSAAKYSLAGMANSGTAGYFGGGRNPVSAVHYSAIEKLLFSADTISTIGGGLSDARYGPSGFANSGTAGYFAGGEFFSTQTSTYTRYNNIEKCLFSTDSVSLVSGGFSQNLSGTVGFANSGTI